MDQVQTQVQTIVRDSVETIETVLNRSLDNVYISTTIKVLIGLYAAFAAPKLPPSLVDLMDNIIVRVAFAFVIVLFLLFCWETGMSFWANEDTEKSMKMGGMLLIISILLIVNVTFTWMDNAGKTKKEKLKERMRHHMDIMMMFNLILSAAGFGTFYYLFYMNE